MTRPELLLSMTRDHLVHVMPELRICGMYSMLIEMPRLLGQYHHTLVHNTKLTVLDMDVVMNLQAQGVEVLHTERIDAECIDKLNPTGLIIYDAAATAMDANVGLYTPSIHYAYGNYDPAILSSVVVPCSKYASKWNTNGDPLRLSNELVIAPLLDARALRQIAGNPGNFTVAIITSGDHNKYPYSLVERAIKELPKDIVLSISKPPTPISRPTMWDNVIEAIRSRPSTRLCRLYPQAALLYTVNADVLLYSTPLNYLEPYGRTVVEAMALGKVVICERKGVFKHELEDKVNALLFDSIDEAFELVRWIRQDTQARQTIGANAQMWASWHDVSVHARKLKRTLKMIGA